MQQHQHHDMGKPLRVKGIRESALVLMQYKEISVETQVAGV